MKSGETAEHGNGHPSVPNRTASEARRPEAGSRAGGVSRAERGNDGSPKGRDAAGGSMRNAHDSATGHLPGGRERPAFKAEEATESGRAPRKAPWICCEWNLADPAQPGRRCSGAPSLRGGDSPQGFPLEGKPKARRHRATWARCEGASRDAPRPGQTITRPASRASRA